MTDKVYIRFPIDDWGENKDIVPKDIDHMVEMLLDGDAEVNDLTKAYIYGRETEMSDPHVLPENKTLLLKGGMLSVGEKIRVMTKIIEIGGKNRKVRKIIARPPHQELDDNETFDSEADATHASDPSWAEVGSDLSLDYRWQFMQTVLPGYLWNSLVILAGCNGIAESEKGAAFLHDLVDEMMVRLRAENGDE